MFGDGVFGPGGFVWCCAFTCAAPALYLAMFMIGRVVPHFTPFGWSLVTVLLAYFWAGFLFGDAIGIIAAALAFLATGSVLVAGPRRVVYEARKRKIMPQRFAIFEDDVTIDMPQ